MSIKEALVESNFGMILCKVNFNKIICDRIDFQDPRKLGTGNVEDIKRYGTAITVVEEMKKFHWVYTVENILVCTNYADDIGTVLVDVRIDENVDILNSTHYIHNIKGGADFNAEIDSLDSNTILSKLHLRCVFK